MLVHLAALYYGRDIDIVTFNKEEGGGHIFRVLHIELQGNIPMIFQ